MDIKVGLGIGPLLFGMTIDETRQAMRVEHPETVEKGMPGEPPCDLFNEEIYAYYNKAGRLQAVECWAPVRPTLDGINLLGMSAKEAMTLLSSRDPSLTYERGGATARSLGVGLYIPHPGREAREPAETVIVFEKGYYD